jgi:hypothetical protein
VVARRWLLEKWALNSLNAYSKKVRIGNQVNPENQVNPNNQVNPKNQVNPENRAEKSQNGN